MITESQRKDLLKRREELITEIKRSKIVLKDTIDELKSVSKHIAITEHGIKQNEIMIKNINKKLGDA